MLDLICMSLAARGFAADSTAGPLSLKPQLRELNKRIHPDRSHAVPPARDTNEKSVMPASSRIPCCRCRFTLVVAIHARHDAYFCCIAT